MTWKGKDMKYNRFLFLLQVSTHRTKDKEFGLLPTVTTRSDSGRETTMENGILKNKSHTTGTNYGITLGQLAKAKLLPTPTASEGGKATGSPNQNQMSLTKMVREGLLPTPNAYDWNTARKEETYIAAKKRHAEKGVNLQNPLKQMAVMGMLPTPNQRDIKGCTKPGLRTTITGKTQKYGEALPDTVKRITSSTSQLNPLFVEEMMGFPENWTLLPFLNGEMSQSKDLETL
jgi:hypothetical protein